MAHRKANTYSFPVFPKEKMTKNITGIISLRSDILYNVLTGTESVNVENISKESVSKDVN